MTAWSHQTFDQTDSCFGSFDQNLSPYVLSFSVKKSEESKAAEFAPLPEVSKDRFYQVETNEVKAALADSQSAVFNFFSDDDFGADSDEGEKKSSTGSKAGVLFVAYIFCWIFNLWSITLCLLFRDRH